MSLQKAPTQIAFARLERKKPFYATLPLYTKTKDYKEEIKEHFLIKLGRNCAMTPDKRTLVHIHADMMIHSAIPVMDKK